MRFPRSLPAVASLAALAALYACGRDDSTGPSATRPAAIISDGTRSGGNPNFFFLPPLLPDPSADADFSAGEFNGGWRPIVELCEVDANNLDAGCLGAPIRTYGDAAVAVSVADEHYKVDIDTRETWAVGGKTYRATVKVVGKRVVVLGFVDVTLAEDKGSARNARSTTTDAVALQDGRTLPLRFRIENGATVSPDAPVYAEQVVTQEGDTVRAGEGGGPGTFAAAFPAGWLPEGYDQVVVTIERLNVDASNPCVTSVPNLIQTSDCWRVETYPELPGLAADVTVAFCPSIPESDPRSEAQTMYKFDAPQSLRELPNVATTLVNCAATGSIGRLPDDLLGRLRHRATQFARMVGDVVGPKTAYAIDAGWGGTIVASDEEAFSEFFWGIPLEVTTFGGDGQSGAAGSTLPTPLSVRVTGEHVHDSIVPIAGVPVIFAPLAGAVSADTVLTDADGIASVSWTLGSTAGAQSLVASVNSVGSVTSQTFTATATTAGLISCTGAAAYGGDFIDRGFYVGSYPGTTLEGADLRFSAATAGTYAIQLVARQGGYGTAGTFLAVDTVSVTLAADINAFVGGSFRWPSVNVQQGAVVAFEMSVVGGPTSQLPYYSVPSLGDASCGITQTEGTTPPLDSPRRQGVWTVIYGTAPIIL